MSPAPDVRGGRKVPRIDYAKYRGGRAAGRREAVTILGDSLRDFGCVRVQGHAGEPSSAASADPLLVAAAGTGGERGSAALRHVAEGLLEGVAEYFGLPGAAFTGAAAPELVPVIDEVATVGGLGTGRELLLVPGVLLLLPEVPAGLAVRSPSGDWWEVAAHPGELLAFPGEALARMTAGRVPAGGVRWPPTGVAGWLLPGGSPDAETAPLTAFLDR